MKTEEEIRVFYKEEFQKILFPLEEYRLSKIPGVKRKIVYGSLLLLITIISFPLQAQFLTFVFFFCALLFYGYAFQSINKIRDNLRKSFKYKVLPILLDFLFDNFEYIPNQRIAKSVFIKSKLITEDITHVVGEDFMRFRIGETGIMFCESDVYRMSKSNNSVFHGIFICSSFNKYFKNETIVLSKPSVPLFQSIDYGLFRGFQRIYLEDIEFNKKFIVFGKDQVESRYILTPALMERMLNYKRKTRKKISFSFIEDRLYCIIPNSINLFEPVIFDSFLDFNFFQKNYEPIKLFTDLVDDLNLNVRIWSKQ